jgi:hypothetical protein
MRTVIPSPLVKWSLVVDAVASGSIAALHLAAPDLLVRLLDLPRALLVETGAFLVAYVALLLLLARSRRLWTLLVGAVVAGNAAWAVASLLLPISGLVAANAWGVAYIVVQALAVAGFAAAQYVGLKQSLPAAAGPGVGRGVLG